MWETKQKEYKKGTEMVHTKQKATDLGKRPAVMGGVGTDGEGWS